ncbi:hypothetical protein C8Q73DRAFT_309271 [Cubamyces lactineus]|nr:hypothetical protein C8Q73DRAFT_309271 [Cubamyces lactineus]
MSNLGEARRLSGNPTLTYDVSAPPSHPVFPTHTSWYHAQRQQPYSEHRLATPPAPTAGYPYYDRYPPEEPPAPTFREGYATEFGPNYWRPERDFFPTTPSPERFRPPQVEAWPRPASWQEPEPPAWPERREVAREPYTPQWNRPARDVPATRMFEPSDNWKQSHVGPMPYPESVPPVRERPAERYPELPPREFRERPAERPRPREVYSPPQPTGERYRPYSPPSSSAARNRFPYPNARSDSHRPPLPEVDWAPEDDDLYADRNEGINREPTVAYPVLPASQDRVDRRFRPKDSVERSVSPISPRPTQHPSPGYMSGVASMPKRESPELPHLEALPPKPYSSQPVRIPTTVEQQHPNLPRKPVSRSPSHSSTASSSYLPHVSAQPPQRSGLPPKPQPQFQPQSRPSQIPSQVPLRAQTKSPALQISPVTGVSPGVDSLASTPQEEHTPAAQSTSIASHLQPHHGSVRPTSGPSAQANKGWGNGRRSYLQKAPSFVPSTLAIDAKLKFPEIGAVNRATQLSHSEQAESSHTAQATPRGREDGAESDMEMSLPASPVRSHTPAALSALDVVSEVKGLGEREEPQAYRTEQSRDDSEDAEDAADTSDMDMSPPASPVLAPAPTSVNVQSPASLGHEQKNELVRPSLSINTSIASPQPTRAVPRQRPPPSSTASTPEPGGDDSDMEMSSPTSSVAPSPRPASPPLAPEAMSQLPTSPLRTPRSLPRHADAAAQVHLASPTNVIEPSAQNKPVIPAHRDAAVSPLVSHASLSVPASAAATPKAQARHGVFQEGSGVSASPRIRRTTASMERLHVDSGELSPPVSEETLREETEGIDKDAESTAHLEKEVPSGTSKQPLPSTTEQGATDSEKMMTDIPLADALRMVVRLRMQFPSQSQEERVEPVIMSNRHIAEPEEPEAPASEALVESVIEKEREQLSSGSFEGTKHSLRKRFAEHQAALADKVERLRKEYLALHEKWLVHCSKLDEVARASALEEAAATAGRTTRRSAAMGDAVRTDLEMEQILASLGNEELTDANHLSAKNAATIPDMLSVTKGRVDVVFDDTNNLVEDPHSFYALETGIDDWTDEEKAIFLEKYAMHPKQFGIIAEFLPHKTPAQCVTFYYLHKNTTIDFRKVVAQFNTVGKRSRRGRGGKQKGNALLADILKHDDELSRDSTPNTTSGRRRRGPASAPAIAPAPAPVSTPAHEQEAGPSTPVVVEQQRTRNASRRSTTQNTPVGTPTPDPEPAPKRPRRRANPTAKAVAALNQDNGDDGVDEDARPAKRVRKSRKSKAGDAETAPTTATEDVSGTPVPAGETRFIDQTEATARKKSGGNGANWSDEDKDLFLKLLAQHGDDFKRIAASMPNKTTIQVTSFYKANLAEMELAKVAAMAPKRSPTPSGSGGATPSASTKPSTPAAENSTATSTDVHTRRGSGVGSSASAEADGVSVSSEDPASASSGRTVLPASVDAIRAHFQASKGSFATPTSPPPPDSSRAPTASGSLSGPSAFTAQTPTALTTTFPTFSYNNLGPSNFVAGQPPPSAFARLSAPQSNGSASAPPMMMEFSDFAPQPWMTQGGNGAQVPGLPATLETTEDLVRYLEHRTRLTAGQNNDSDFM